jgi:hypothetical protein
MKTVAMSMTWGLETTRSQIGHHKMLASAQRFQIVKMMGLKRQTYEGGIVEEWLSWHIRKFRQAKAIIKQCNADIVDFVRNKRLNFAGHVARFGTAEREQHIVKNVLLWRCLGWWRQQQRYNLKLPDHEQFLHTMIFGKPRRWESQFPTEYLNKFLAKDS